jgi:hypothetical protein
MVEAKAHHSPLCAQSGDVLMVTRLDRLGFAWFSVGGPRRVFGPQCGLALTCFACFIRSKIRFPAFRRNSFRARADLGPFCLPPNMFRPRRRAAGLQ